MTIDTQADDYVQTQHTIALIANLIREMPLEEHVATQRHALEIGPYIDPTAWIHGNKKLAFDKRLAEALLSFQREVEEIMGEGER